MYINEVLRLAKQYLPSEYSDNELYCWCNEVSAQLAVEERCVYRRYDLPVSSDGDVLLPPEVRVENIVAASLGGKPLRKEQFLRHAAGLHRIRGYNIRGYNIHGYCDGHILHLIAEAPYEPIRLTNYRGEAEFTEENGTGVIYLGCCDLVTGDTVQITVNPDGAASEERDCVQIMARRMEITPKNQLRLEVSGLDGLQGSFDDCEITRIVTDETVCQPPYDGMYVEYLLARISYFQKDYESYEYHMSAFNARLADYRRYLVKHLPHDEGKLVNWW